MAAQLSGDPVGGAARDSPLVPDPSAPRIAVYGAGSEPPTVVSIDDPRLPELIETLARRTFELARERGGALPYAAVRPVVENLLHAGFVDVVITILADGSTIRVADGGPGIPDKAGALRPGFTTAGPVERRNIPGVGAGLSLAQAALESIDGHLQIEDNLVRGTVVTLSAPPPPVPEPEDTPAAGLALSGRRLRLLALVLELGPVGPTRLAKELGVSASTAYREMVWLERTALVTPDPEGRRTITQAGLRYLERVL